jgi:transposase-like protein
VAAKKKQANGRKSGAAPTSGERRTRMQRSDEEKVRLVRLVMESDNQSAEIKRIGIYPNQFYDWKKKYSAQLGGSAGNGGSRNQRGRSASQSRSASDEARAFISGKASLLEKLRAQRQELDRLISELAN